MKLKATASNNNRCAYLSIGNSRLTVSNYEYRSAKVPESFSGFNIIQISDLHNRAFGDGQRKLISAVKEQNPDIIVITGDLIDRRRPDFETAFEFVNKAVSVSPVYFVTGNHEEMPKKAEKIARMLSSAGVKVLAGEYYTIKRGGESIRVAGVPDPSRFGCDSGAVSAAAKKKMKKMLLNALSKESETLKILLAHRPKLIDMYKECGADIVFSGHVHGGQIRLPLIGGLYSPGQGIFPRFTSGMHRFGDTTLIISRGLGNSIFPLRMFNPPEIVVVKLIRN